MKLRCLVFIIACATVGCGPRSSSAPRKFLGCATRGCGSGSFCDTETGYCSTRTCGEGCPKGSTCNRGLDRCEGPRPLGDLEGPWGPADHEYQGDRTHGNDPSRWSN